MPKPLNLFLSLPLTGYQLQTAFGASEPYLILRNAGAPALVLAAVSGRLSARLPGHRAPEPEAPITPPDATEPLPRFAFLTLTPSFGELLGRTNAFRDKLAVEFPGLHFKYVVDGRLLEDILGPGLSRVALAADTPPTSAELIRLFLAGVIDVSVRAGDIVGRIDPLSGLTLIPFGVASEGEGGGPVDPSFFYNRMRDFVEQGALGVDAFLAVAPSVWPILGATKEELLSETTAALYPYSALVEAKNRLALTRAEWRTVGNNQKQQYRRRLLQRAGHAPAGSTDPAFEFNDSDWANVFQLEAIAEFYVNFREPWQAGAVPQDPATNPPTAANPDVGPVDLLDLAGTNATVAGPVVTIGDADADFARVRQRANTGDVIVLDADTARASRTYRITNKNVGARTLTLDAAPQLPAGVSSTAWRIHARPVIVLIDPFGPRAAGELASIGNVQGGLTNVTLDRSVGEDRTRVNPFFDTIHFRADTATGAGRVGPLKTYRIVQVAGSRLLVEGRPQFTTSAWAIQAGLGAAVDPAPFANGPLDYDLRGRGNNGFDHFDAMMFVVYGDTVRVRERWNSYTARGNATRMNRSTVDGNRGYDLQTWRSGESSRRNYCVKVVDWGTVDTGADLCAHARYFYDPLASVPPAPVTEDTGGTIPRDTPGKTEIRFHYSRYLHDQGVTTCDSAGCLVSGNMTTLRSDLARIHRGEYQATHPGAAPTNVQVLIGATQEAIARAGGIYDTNRARDWHQALVGRLWLIRPDQLPIGYARPAGT